MKHISLTQGRTAIVDDEDYEELAKYKWCYAKSKRGGYAVRLPRVNGKKKTIYMHRQIMNMPTGKEIDHIDGNGINNRRDNLRIASASQNQGNVTGWKNNTSGYRGVVFKAANKKWNVDKWRAQISVNGKQICLGSFDTKEEAARCYNEGARKHFGVFAKLNSLPEG